MPVPEDVQKARAKYFKSRDDAWAEYSKAVEKAATEKDRKSAENYRIATIRKAYFEYEEVLDANIDREG